MAKNQRLLQWILGCSQISKVMFNQMQILCGYGPECLCLYLPYVSIFGNRSSPAVTATQRGCKRRTKGRKNHPETRGVVIGFTTSKIQFSDQPWKTHVPGWWLKNHLEKYESQWQGWHPILWNIIQMFQTTNQMKNTDEKHMYSSSKQIAHSPPK